MSVLIITLLIGLIIGWIRGGSIWSFRSLPLKSIWLLPLSYILQYISIYFLHGLYYQVVILISFLTLFYFCYVNHKIGGIKWAFIGTALNFLVMVSNSLRMPAYMPAVNQLNPKAVSLMEHGQIGKSIAMTSHTHLNFLGDIFLFNIQPSALMSVGDILFSVGLIILIQFAMRIERETSSNAIV